MYGIIEPIIAGMTVSILNRILFGGNLNLTNCCETNIVETIEHEKSDDSLSSESSAIIESTTHHHTIHMM